MIPYSSCPTPRAAAASRGSVHSTEESTQSPSLVNSFKSGRPCCSVSCHGQAQVKEDSAAPTRRLHAAGVISSTAQKNHKARGFSSSADRCSALSRGFDHGLVWCAPAAQHRPTVRVFVDDAHEDHKLATGDRDNRHTAGKLDHVDTRSLFVSPDWPLNCEILHALCVCFVLSPCNFKVSLKRVLVPRHFCVAHLGMTDSTEVS